MKRTGWIVIGAVLLVVVILFATLMGSYNSLVKLDEEVQKAYADIETYLKRRADLIPNLVNTVKGFDIQEQAVIDSVTEARAKMSGASGEEEMLAAGQEMETALSRLLVVVENYPEIKSDKMYIGLMDELAGTENRLSVARSDYNEAVSKYNGKIRRFPSNILAGMFNFEAKEYFEASEADREVPQVNFE